MPLDLKDQDFPEKFMAQKEIAIRNFVYLSLDGEVIQGESPANDFRKVKRLVFLLHPSDDYGVSAILQKNRYAQFPPGLYCRNEIRACLEQGIRLSLGYRESGAYIPYDPKKSVGRPKASSFGMFSGTVPTALPEAKAGQNKRRRTAPVVPSVSNNNHRVTKARR